jgi:hypothetical protein
VVDHNGRIEIDQPNQEIFDYLFYATVSVDLKVLTLVDGWHLKELLLNEQCSKEMCKQGLTDTDDYLGARKFGRKQGLTDTNDYLGARKFGRG